MSDSRAQIEVLVRKAWRKMFGPERVAVVASGCRYYTARNFIICAFKVELSRLLN